MVISHSFSNFHSVPMKQTTRHKDYNGYNCFINVHDGKLSIIKKNSAEVLNSIILKNTNGEQLDKLNDIFASFYRIV